MSRVKPLIAVAVTAAAVVVLTSPAYGAGFGVEFAGGGTSKSLINVGEEKTIEIINQAVVAQKLTEVQEIFRKNGKEYMAFDEAERNACVVKNFASGEKCPIKVKLVKERPAGEPIAEAELVVLPAGCPNAVKVLA